MNPIILEILPFIGSLLVSASKMFGKGNKKIVIAILVFFFLKWAVNKAALETAKDNQQVKIDPITGDPVIPSYSNPASLAKEYYAAFDPHNTGFLPFNGTDTEALYALAARTFNWAEIRTAYRTLYQRDLTEDLESELSASELVLFNQILNRSK